MSSPKSEKALTFQCLTKLIFTFILYYLAVQTHPATIQCVFTEPGGSTQVVFPRRGIDHLQPLVSNRPVHTEVGRFSRLTSLRVTYSFEHKKPNNPKNNGFASILFLFFIPILEHCQTITNTQVWHFVACIAMFKVQLLFTKH